MRLRRILRHALVNNYWSYSNDHHQVDVFLQFGRLSPTVPLELWGGTECVYSDLCKKKYTQRTSLWDCPLAAKLKSICRSALVLNSSHTCRHASYQHESPTTYTMIGHLSPKTTKLCNLQATSLHTHTHRDSIHTSHAELQSGVPQTARPVLKVK